MDIKMITRTRNRIYFFAFIALFSFVFTFVTFAAPPASPYNPGETLDPGCVPGGTNCTVASPVITGSASSGLVTFWNGTSTLSGTSTLTWDNTNLRLGI